jgi:hypothetical protein
MNILDENILKDQRELLLSRRVKIRQIGYDIGRKGIQDDEIIPLLLQLRRPTFFTLDFDFYDRNLCHAGYCLVCMDVRQDEAAAFVHRLLRHKEFNTQAKRMGKVIRLSTVGLSIWGIHGEQEIRFSWQSK